MLNKVVVSVCRVKDRDVSEHTDTASFTGRALTKLVPLKLDMEITMSDGLEPAHPAPSHPEQGTAKDSSASGDSGHAVQSTEVAAKRRSASGSASANGLAEPETEKTEPAAIIQASNAGAHCPALRRTPNDHAFFPTLLSTAVIFITFAVMITVTLYLVEENVDLGGEAVRLQEVPTWWDEWKHIIAPAVGTLVPLIAAILFVRFRGDYAQPDRAEPQVCGELRGRLGALDARLPVLCPQSGPALCDHESQLACNSKL